MPKLEAIIFDMDGLMLDTERLAQQAWLEVTASKGYTLTPADYQAVIGRNRKGTTAFFQEKFGADFPIEALYAQKQARLMDLMETEGIPIKPGLWPLLAQVDAWGLKKAVATSTYRDLALKKLAWTNLLPQFAVIVAGDEVAQGKPAPDSYLAAAKLLQVEPAACIVLEDSEPGVQAAHSAGMRVIMVPDLKPPSAKIQQVADVVLPSLKAVPEVVRGWVEEKDS